MRIYISGQKQFGADAYRLAKRMGHEIVGVSAPAFSTTGGSADKLRALAELDGVPWLEAGALRADRLPDGTDLILAAHSHDFIGRKTRHRAAIGAIGYHPSLLPRHRGRDAIRWTIRDRDPVTGGTVYWLSERMDGGDIAAQDFVFVSPDETPESLWREKLAPLGLRLLERVLKDIAGGVIRRRRQPEEYATWEPSWSRPPAFRPDLELLGRMPAGVRVERELV